MTQGREEEEGGHFGSHTGYGEEAKREERDERLIDRWEKRQSMHTRG